MKRILIILICASSGILHAQQTASKFWEEAKTEISNVNYNYSNVCNLLDTVIKHTATGDPLNIEAKLVLAQVHGNEVELDRMQNVIDDLQRYVENYPDDKETAAELDSIIAFKNEIIRLNTSFFDDVCGIWVSDYSVSADKIPYLAFTVTKISENGKYQATILPFCSLYAAIKSEDAARGYNTKVRSNYANLYFGSERYKKGNPFAAQMGIEFVGSFGRELIKGFKYQQLINPNKLDLGSMLGGAATEILVDLALTALIEWSVSKTYTTTFDMLIDRIFAGCIDITVHESQYLNRSDGQNSEAHFQKKFMMYKLYPEYNVTFAANAYPLYKKWIKINPADSVIGNSKLNKNKICTFGSKQPTDAEIEQLNLNSKNVKDFNIQAYEKLKNKVLGSYASISEDPENDPLTNEIKENFEYCTQGMLRINEKYYRDFTGIKSGKEGLGFSRMPNGEYIGEYVKNARNGKGYYKWDDGDEYDGEWKNNKMHGTGYYKWANGSEYDGEWKNNKMHGKGYYKKDGNEYVGEYKNDMKHGNGYFKWKDGDVFEGTFKNGFRDKGILKYTNGSTHEGIWTKYETKFTGKITDTDGNIFEGESSGNKSKGKVTYLNGDTFTGQETVVKKINTRTGIYEYANGDRYEGRWYEKDGTWLKDGKGKITTGNETVTGIWKDDELVKEQKRTVNEIK
ncbi:MAG: hypothetical protein LBF69_02550 [Prevotellaceae bacterium]|jgi:hypothetical protein|nr:hypothetical protein [Prevotellaceae bacterium]